MVGSDMNMKDKNKQVLDNRISTLKTIYIYNLIVGCFLAFCMLAVIILLTVFPQKEAWIVFIVIAAVLGFGSFSVRGFIFAVKYKKILNALCMADPNETEEKELLCYKFDYLSNAETGNSRHDRKRYVYAICVRTVHGKFYYVFQKDIIDHAINVYCNELYSGEHKFEVYKGTNIIKSFPALEKLLRSIPQKFLDS